MLVITNAIITAYCHCVLCCGKHSTAGITASGDIPIQGITIAAPRNIQLGTKVRVNGHYYIVQDRTSKRFNGRWDVYFSSHREALRFGKQKQTIEIIQ